MVIVKGLIWDDWNKNHIAQHNITTNEVEEVCHGRFQAFESYRKRIQIHGKTKMKRKIVVILSGEDRNLIRYEEGIYYPITAFDEEGEEL